jgi:hypothetical protein
MLKQFIPFKEYQRRWQLMDHEAETHPKVYQLLAKLQAHLPQLSELLAELEGHWAHEDSIYRFYHQSTKVYDLQSYTTRIVEQLQLLLPDTSLNEMFTQIIAEGTGLAFDGAHNRNWMVVTRPIVEAFFHARYFLEMLVKYGNKLEFPPNQLPSGWAAILCLYNLR